MASIILSSVGASVGNMILPGLGGKLLGALGRKVGRSIDSEIGWSSSSSAKDGARLENFKVQDSRYGLAIPLTFGQVRVAGNVIWSSDLIETAHHEKVSGGKGGALSSSDTRTTYSYSLNCAIAIGEGEIGGIQTIWADSKVIYQNGVWLSGVVASATIHNGAADQPVDPLLESWTGSGATPAYCGVAYIVFEGLQLAKFGNRLPNMTFEIVPPIAQSAPVWLGQAEPQPDFMASVLSNKQGGMPPLVIEGGAVCAREMLVGGYQSDGTTGQFVIVRYDVTGEAPVELRRDVSPSFACQDVGDHCWAMAPDGRFLALGLQDGSSGQPYHLVLFDTLTSSFGSVKSTAMVSMEVRQIAWIDAQRLIVNEARDTVRGVRVILRAGSGLRDCGFFDVWGAGSASNRVPVAYTQFRTYGDGLMTYMGDRALNFTVLYGRRLTWSDNRLVVGEAFTVSSGHDVGTGSGPVVRLHQTGEDEWTLFYLTMIDMQMMSFIPAPDGVTVTRPWQKFTTSVFTASACSVPVVSGGRVVILHRPTTQTRYRISTFTLDDGVFTRETDAVAVPDFVSSAQTFQAARVSAARLLIAGNVGFAGALGQLGLIKLYDSGDTLDNVVGKLLRRAGYEESDYALEALADTVVEGYTLSEQSTAASALEQLMILRPFDLVETDGVLRAVVHGAGTEVTVEAVEAAATRDLTDEPAALLAQSRTQELDLPLELGVDYLDASRDYEVGSQRARRYAARGAVAKLTLEMPLVVTASEAKHLAQRHLYAMWIERDQVRLVLSRAWAALEPSDILVFEGKRIRVTGVTMKAGLVQIDGVAAVPADLQGNGQAENGSVGGAILREEVRSVAYLMDLPLLRSEDNQSGVYVAASGLDGWKGATLWRAADGVTFTNVTSLSLAATAGVAVGVLPEVPCAVTDTASRLQVQLLRGTLSSCTGAELLNGANAALCGGEILQFRTATLIGPNLYELSTFLRGRKGTESAAATHAVGEDFVLLADATMQFLPAPMTDRNVAYHFRAVSTGGSLDLAQDRTLTYGMRTLRPYAPAHVRGQRAAGTGSDLTISWVRRARLNAAWLDYIDVPLDETQELYDVEILDGATVVRSFAGVAVPSVTYSAAQQAADWGGAIPSSFAVRVSQLGTNYGRGDAAEGVV